MAKQQPISTLTPNNSHRLDLIHGDLCIGYLVEHQTNPSAILSDRSGRAIARTIGFTLDEAVDTANQIVKAFNRYRRWARVRRLVRRAASFSIVGAAVYALIVAACLFKR